MKAARCKKSEARKNRFPSSEAVFLASCLLLLTIGFSSCAGLGKSPETARQEARKKLLLADWSRRVEGNVRYQDGRVGFVPESFRQTSCYLTRDFEEFTLAEPPAGDVGFGTQALYCPATRSYWINRYGGTRRYYNGWAGPFAFEMPKEPPVSEKI